MHLSLAGFVVIVWRTVRVQVRATIRFEARVGLFFARSSRPNQLKLSETRGNGNEATNWRETRQRLNPSVQ